MLSHLEMIELLLDRGNVCSYLGYRSKDTPSASIASLIDDCIAKSLPLLQPTFTYVMKDVSLVQGNIVLLDDGTRFESAVIARLLELCDRVAVYVSTIGPNIEDMSSALAEDGFITEAYVVDSIGSCAIEKLAQSLYEKVAEEASSSGLCVSRRFSPGYCDWHIDQQRTIFNMLDGDSVGVSLTPDYLMIPRKSSSGLIGIGRSDGYVETYNPCVTCDKVVCPGRR